MNTVKENIEHLHNDVFGKTFALYNKEQMLKFIKPFQIRFKRNNIDPTKLFLNKKCLDAGCGGGRGSIFMAMHGAKEIISLDVSKINIQSTKRNADIFGFSKIIQAQVSSLENINFEDNSFDFIWCNGVLMHTHNPDKCLRELARVLKIGGKSWLYVYGSGGVYWYCIYKFREFIKNASENSCLNAMKFAQIPTEFLAEYMDDWKAPYLRTYTNKDFSIRLSQLGFTNIEPLLFGTDYDTSHRINKFPGDNIFLGEGDLRYLGTMTKKPSVEFKIEQPISSSEKGSYYSYPDIYTKAIDDRFSQISKYSKNSLLIKVLTCAYIQRNLRDIIFSGSQAFKLEKLIAIFDEAIILLKNGGII